MKTIRARIRALFLRACVACMRRAFASHTYFQVVTRNDDPLQIPLIVTFAIDPYIFLAVLDALRAGANENIAAGGGRHSNNAAELVARQKKTPPPTVH